jgi:hypothetical protein
LVAAHQGYVAGMQHLWPSSMQIQSPNYQLTEHIRAATETVLLLLLLLLLRLTSRVPGSKASAAAGRTGCQRDRCTCKTEDFKQLMCQ